MTVMDLGCVVAVAPVSDLSAVVLVSQSAESFSLDARAGVRELAGGRRQVVSVAGDRSRVDVSFNSLERAEFEALEALTGRVVLFRDQRGRRLFSMFSEIGGVEIDSAPDLVMSVSLSLSAVTVSEIV